MIMTMRLVVRLFSWLDVILMNLMKFFFVFCPGEEFGSGPTLPT